MGPLEGIRIIEMAGLGPGPYCGMLLADMGADVIRVDRPGSGDPLHGEPKGDTMGRGKRSIQLDMRKSAEDKEVFWKLLDTADILFEGMRPGVMERLGIGPDECLKRRPKLVYGRMTGFGQTGPMALAAGHDINYAAMSGTLAHIGTKEQPIIPLNLVADFGGVVRFLAMGLLGALIKVQRGGAGQVVDATMLDGAASMANIFFGLMATGRWTPNRGENFLDGGAHFYNTYATKDGEWISIGAIEPQFYADLLKALGISEDPSYADYFNRDKWPAWREDFTRRFKEKTRDEWTAIFAKLDACYAPILNWINAKDHPHNIERKVFIEVDGVTQPAPAPRFGGTPTSVRGGPPSVGQSTNEILKELGLPPR